MKKYQIAIISFALGIFVLTFFLTWIARKGDNIESTDNSYVKTEETSVVKVFFSNNVEDPGTLYCERTYPAERSVTRMTDSSQSVLGELAYLAISELLKGPTEAEKGAGFSTSINIGTKVQKIIIEEGVARADFNEVLDKYVAGSCRVQAIRSQITETLKQFPEIKEVIISVDGRIEDILQP